MKDIRIGNDIKVTLIVTRHGHKEPLREKELVIMLRNKRKAIEITDFHVEDGNRVVFVWRGADQQVLGPYFVTLYVRKGQRQNVEDTGYIFNLVPVSHEIDSCHGSHNNHDHECGCVHDNRINVGVQVGAWCDWHEHADYRNLHHKPSINGVELIGNMSLHMLGIQPEGDYVTLEQFEQLNELFDKIGILPFDGWANSVEELPELADKGSGLLGSGTTKICFVEGEAGGFYKVEPDGSYSRVYVRRNNNGIGFRPRTDVIYRNSNQLYVLEMNYMPDGINIYTCHLEPYSSNGEWAELDDDDMKDVLDVLKDSK